MRLVCLNQPLKTKVPVPPSETGSPKIEIGQEIEVGNGLIEYKEKFAFYNE